MSYETNARIITALAFLTLALVITVPLLIVSTVIRWRDGG